METREATNIIKKHLKRKFGVTARITTKFFAGGSSIKIKYPENVPTSLIKAELAHLEAGSFDSMNDLYTYHKSKMIIDGHELPRYKYMFVSQIKEK